MYVLGAIIGVMTFIVSLGVAETFSGITHPTFLFFLQDNRSALYLCIGIVLAVGLLGHAGKIRTSNVGIQAWLLMAMALFQSFMRIYHESLPDAVITAGFAFATLGPLMFIFPALLEERDGWFKMVRLVMWISLVWIICTAIQFGTGRSVLTMAGRFVGFTGNAQSTALVQSVPTIVGLWLILNDPKWRYRWLWISLFGINLILLGWTGSRTGALMTICGATAVLYRRAGRAILLMPLAALAVWGVYEFMLAQGVDLGLERLTSTKDTRTRAWAAMLDQAMQNPMVGTGTIQAAASENSYLYGFVSFGVGMLALIILFTLASIYFCMRLHRAGRRLPRWRPFIDLIIAFNLMYFSSAFFEGIITARAREMLVYMLMFGAMGTMLLRYAAAGIEPAYGDQDDQLEAFDADEDTAGEPYAETAHAGYRYS
jgi:hypothetical protein